MSAYYNEIEPFAAQWLRNLSEGELISPGHVDDRSIRDVRAVDLAGYAQCHFFAGLGGWSHALRLAGWPDDVPVWTGSCPCQPFSAAGARRGFNDPRHLWPEWFRLIRECRPAIVFGEQVASGDGLRWFDAVSSDLEAAGYAVGAADLCAAGSGAPHLRQRLFFVAIAASDGLQRRCDRNAREYAEPLGLLPPGPGQYGPGPVGDPHREGAGRHPRGVAGAEAPREREGVRDGDLGHGAVPSGATRGFWAPADWLPCSDGKARAVEPGTFPLAHGVPGRVGQVRAYGNAIVPEVAATFIRSVIDAIY